MNTDFSRSKALNTIPKKKVYAKLLSVVQNCETCSNKEVMGDSFDGLCSKCALIHTAYNRYAESNIPIEYWALKMEKHFKGYKPLFLSYEEIVNDLKKSYLTGKSICFAGSHGLGKTMTVANILKKANQKGYTALYTTLSDIVNVLTQADGEEKYLSRRELTMVDFLVIDEFDPRFMPTENAADLYARTLESVFRTRSQNKLPTFMCTNSPNPVEAFNGALKASIKSLMSGYIQVQIVFGDDFRSKLKIPDEIDQLVKDSDNLGNKE